MASRFRSVIADGSRPMLRSRNSFHSAVVNRFRPSLRASSTSRFDSWIGRRPAIPNGRPFVSWAITAS